MNLKRSKLSSTISVTVDGPHLPMNKFRKLLGSFMGVLNEIDKETSENKKQTVDWGISSLSYNSPLKLTAEAIPIAENIGIERPAEVISIFQNGIKALQSQFAYPEGFSNLALKKAKTFADIINPDDFAEITFSGDGWQTSITGDLVAGVDKLVTQTYKSYGSVEGQLLSINLAKRKQFGVKTNLQSATVKCFFKDDELLEEARKYLNCRVYVYGIIRKRESGEKINIDVIEIDKLPGSDDLPSAQEMLRELWSRS